MHKICASLPRRGRPRRAEIYSGSPGGCRRTAACPRPAAPLNASPHRRCASSPDPPVGPPFHQVLDHDTARLHVAVDVDAHACWSTAMDSSALAMAQHLAQLGHQGSPPLGSSCNYSTSAHDLDEIAAFTNRSATGSGIRRIIAKASVGRSDDTSVFRRGNGRAGPAGWAARWTTTPGLPPRRGCPRSARRGPRRCNCLRFFSNDSAPSTVRRKAATYDEDEDGLGVQGVGAAGTAAEA